MIEKNAAVPKSRIAWIDIAKAIAIFAMIEGHGCLWRICQKSDILFPYAAVLYINRFHHKGGYGFP